MFSTCGEGLDLQPDASWYLWLGLGLFHAFFPKESGLRSPLGTSMFIHGNLRGGKGGVAGGSGPAC